jgi:hypothetical protein
MLLLAAPGAAQAQFIYTTNNGAITLYQYAGGGGAVVVSNFVANIAGYAFLNCTNVTSVTIPGSVSNIGEWAFYYCTGLTSVAIFSGVTTIGDDAFIYCASLDSVNFPDTVTGIGGAAFYGCASLPSVRIPPSVTSIGDYAFADCTKLTAISVNTNNAIYSSSNGVLFANRRGTLLQFPGGLGGSYAIQGSVTNIGAGAFMYCAGLAGVTIPGSVTSIGEKAFLECGSLTSVMIPASVTSIGDYAFADCASLTNAYFQGNAPNADSTVFDDGNPNACAYYLPGATGWSLAIWGFPLSGPPAELWNPQIQTGGGSFGMHGGQFEFTITGTAGIPIVVEACTNLAFPVWAPVLTNTLASGSCSFSDTYHANNRASFYRIRSP